MKTRKLGKGRWVSGDCLEAISRLPDDCIDVAVVPDIDGKEWELLYKALNRVVKPKGAIIFAGKNKYLKDIMLKKAKTLRYLWTWFRNKDTNSTEYLPLDSIAIFSRKAVSPPYNTPMIETPYGQYKCFLVKKLDGEDYPQDKYPLRLVNFNFKTDTSPLWKIIIQSYTDNNSVVLNVDAQDWCIAKACEELGLRWLAFCKSIPVSKQSIKMLYKVL